MKTTRGIAGLAGCWLVGAISVQAGSIGVAGPSPTAPPVTNAPAADPAPPRFRTFGNFATNPDQQGIAGQLDARAKQAGTDLASVMDVMTRIPASQVPAALDQLSPATYDADTTAALAAGSRHLQMVAGFLDETATGGQDGGPWTPWVAGISGTDEGRGDSSSRTLGSAGGMDYHFGRNIRFGFAFGAEHTDVTHLDSATRGQIDSLNYSAYAVWKPAFGYLEVIVNRTEQNFDDLRQISFGELNRLAGSQHDGHGNSAYVGTGYDVTMAGLRLRPTAAMEYGRFTQKGFTEDGAGSLNLAVDENTADALQSHVGVRMDYETHLLGMTITPRATVAWGHQFSTDPRELQARFQSGGDAFTVHGVDGAANGLETSGGVAANIFGVAVFMDYGVSFAGGEGMVHTVKAGVWSRF
ncbi:MAG: autotransporter outer membrane beta-barrel domain-containing protein [Kiritimatiellaeota bacterium]|nr:autotransporter outer membrane beta-barrel domain-containing protein [Kiritimatiellota bacterium]